MADSDLLSDLLSLLPPLNISVIDINILALINSYKYKIFVVSVFFFQTASIGIGFLVHNSDTMFPTDLGNRRVSGDIISINVHGIPEMQMLPDPVQMQFQVRLYNS